MMQRDLASYRKSQIFLNYPFDDTFGECEYSLHFPVIAAGLIPVCAKGISTPDKSRLEMIVDAIKNCHYSAHDFSRLVGEGENNFARMNMPLEMGMAIFHAFETQRQNHRCAFFVPDPHSYSHAVSDLAGLDPHCYNNDSKQLLKLMYDWLRKVVPDSVFNSVPTIEVTEKYDEFKSKLSELKGSGENGQPTYNESLELMYQVCESYGGWDWRATRNGKLEFQPIPLAWQC